MKRGPRPRIFATNPWSKRLKRKSGRVGLAEPVAQVVILHVFDYQAVLENEDDFAEPARIEAVDRDRHAVRTDVELQEVFGVKADCVCARLSPSQCIAEWYSGVEVSGLTGQPC